MQVNRQNVEAIRLLTQGRAAEADELVTQTLALDPNNAFALNNMGVVKEMEGELEEAEKYYSRAAASGSQDAVIVTVNPGWRGKPLSEMAADNARKVRERLQSQEDLQARVARLNLRGVAAINRNEWANARQYFQKAYDSDPNNAFALNNFGFLSEMDGDEETAQVFYEKARQAQRANIPVGFATRRSAEGQPLFQIAADNDQQADVRIAQHRVQRSQESGPIELKRRDNTPVESPQTTEPSIQPQAVPPTTETEPGLGPPQPPIPQLITPSQPPGTQTPEPNPQPQR
jgi:Flp pilus assembly protein TadD